MSWQTDDDFHWSHGGDHRHYRGMTSTLMTTAGIHLDSLTKSYGTVRAVNGIDLVIAPGETVALLGPNGAGKSTTIDMILGLAKPDSGTVRVFGQTPAAAIRAGAIGAMLQTGSLLRDLTVRELIAMMASLYPNPMAVDDVLSVTHIEDIADRRTQKLSGGQTQRVRAAIALVSNPDLLILDEPTVAMDVEVRREFWTSMREFAAEGKTVVFATHYLEEADSYADRIVLMARGRIVADGPATEIKATVGLRTIKATLSHVSLTAMNALAGVQSAELRGDSVVLHCTDSDAAIRALLRDFPAASDIEIAGAGLEAAFLFLTGDENSEVLS
jgi:ABC-2 type transport system ATP-binding protein